MFRFNQSTIPCLLGAIVSEDVSAEVQPRELQAAFQHARDLRRHELRPAGGGGGGT